MSPKALIQKLVKWQGYRIVPKARDSQTLLTALSKFDIQTVIDVGANKGSTVADWLQRYPDAKVFALEPLPGPYEELKRTAEANSRVIALNVAAGPVSGPVEMQVHLDHESSSSMLGTTTLSDSVLPFTARQSKLIVDQRRLDDVVNEYSEIMQDGILLKLDVQGYEDPVLKGATELLRRVKVVFTEVGITKLYEGQTTFAEVNEHLQSAGLSFFGFVEQFHSVEGDPVYADIVYVRV